MIDISFDKRLDLIFGLMYCVDKEENSNFNWVRSTYPEFDDAFYKIYKKAITPEFKEYIKSGGLDSYNRSVVVALSLDENYEIINNLNLEKNVKSNTFDKNKLSNYLKEFVQKSDYENFYNGYTKLREELINKFKESLNFSEFINQNILEDFYGYKIGPMKIVLLNFAQGSYGITFDNDIIYVAGMSAYDIVENKFPNMLLNLVHEFSHPYLNPYGEKYFKNINLTNILENSKEFGLHASYINPITVINEYLVRAASTIICNKTKDEGYIERRIRIEQEMGYPFIDEVINIFSKKDDYDTFEEFYKNEIVTYFKDLNKKLENKTL